MCLQRIQLKRWYESKLGHADLDNHVEKRQRSQITPHFGLEILTAYFAAHWQI